MAKIRPKTKKNPVRVTVNPRRSTNPRTVAVVVAGLLVFGTAGLVFANASGDLKTFSPATDLAHYPKSAFVPASLGTNHAPLVDNDEVFSVELTSSNSGVITSFDPSPGVDKRTLFKKLKTQGIRDLIDPDTGKIDPSTADGATITQYAFVGDGGGPAGNSCYFIGTAKGNCAKWAKWGHDHPQIYMIDHTSSQWPVSTATYQWNQAHGIDSTYHWGTCPSITGIHCVHIYDGYYGTAGNWVGSTTLWISGSTITKAQTKLNRSYNTDPKYVGKVGVMSAETACHELGHVLGLNHNASESSCLFPIIDTISSTRPSSDDYSVLATMY